MLLELPSLHLGPTPHPALGPALSSVSFLPPGLTFPRQLLFSLQVPCTSSFPPRTPYFAPASLLSLTQSPKSHVNFLLLPLHQTCTTSPPDASQRSMNPPPSRAGHTQALLPAQHPRGAQPQLCGVSSLSPFQPGLALGPDAPCWQPGLWQLCKPESTRLQGHQVPLCHHHPSIDQILISFCAK